MGTKQYCTFNLANYFFGIEVEKVQEAIRYQELTPVPLAEDVIAGLINLRGNIVTAVDLRKRLTMTPRDENARLPMNIVVHSGDSPVSFLVDHIGDVLEVDEESYEDPPPTLEDQTRELVKGAYKLTGKLLLILNTEKALELGQGDSETTIMAEAV